MTDLEQKKSAALTPSVAKTMNATTIEGAPDLNKSKGEKIYNWTVYSGINYWMNLGISLVIADFFLHKPFAGRKILNQSITKTYEATHAGFKKLGFGSKATELKIFRYCKHALESLALMTGGWLLLAPMKYMEDNKRPIVHWINKKKGVQQVAPDGHELTADEIYLEKEQPPSTWWNVFKRRIYATIAVSAIAGPLIAKVFKVGNVNGKTVATDFIAKHVTSGLTKIGLGGEWLTKSNSTAQRYIKYAALDTFFTLITAVVMRVTNGAKKETPEQIKREEAILHESKASAPATGRSYTDMQKPSDKRKAILSEAPKDFRTRAEAKSTEASVAIP